MGFFYGSELPLVVLCVCQCQADGKEAQDCLNGLLRSFDAQVAAVG